MSDRSPILDYANSETLPPYTAPTGGWFSSIEDESVDGTLVLFSGTTGRVGRKSTAGDAAAIRTEIGAGIGNAFTSNSLSQFATTTSAQLRGVISDETGSGALVFGTGPTLDAVEQLGLRSASVAVRDLRLKNIENLSATRTLLLSVLDFNRSLTIGGDLYFSGQFTTIGSSAATLNFTGTTNVTFPTSGTLATTAGTESPLTFSAPLSRSGNTVSIPAATGSVNGYLPSADWNTFNDKVSSTESVSVDGQVALFNSTNGKIIRKATGTGIAKLAGGVLSVVTAPTGDLVGHEDTQTLYNKTLSLGTLVSNVGLNFERPSGAGIIQFLAPGGSSSLFCYLPSVSGTLITSAEVSDGYVPTSRTVNGHALSANVTVTPTDLGLVIGTNVQAYSANLSHWAVVNASERVTDFLVDPTLANLKVAVTDETTVGWNLLSLANPDAITFLRLNANNSVSALDASTFRTAIGAGTSSTSGTVTSVSVTTANGVSGSVANATTTPAITLSLGAITPESVTAPNDTAMIVSGGHHISGPSWSGASITLDPADPTTHLANVTLTPVAGGSVIISSLSSDGLLKTSGGTGTVGVAAMAAGAETFLATPSSANLRSLVTDETGTGGLVFANTPTLVTPEIGVATGTSLNLSGFLQTGATLDFTNGSAGHTLNVGPFWIDNTTNKRLTFNVQSLTANRIVIWPNAAGTVLLSGDAIPSGYLDIDGTLAANSDAKIASQKAVKTYVTAHTITNSAGATIVPVSNGTNLIASSIVDDGTIVSGGHGRNKFSFDDGSQVTLGDVDQNFNGTTINVDDLHSTIVLTASILNFQIGSAAGLPSSAIAGTSTNDNALSFNLGEYVVASVAQGSAVSLTTATPKTVTSISLTAGDWDVTAIGCLTGASTGTEFDVAIGTTTNSMTGTILGNSRCQTPTVSLAGADASLMIPSFRVSLASLTTIYLIVQETFTLGSPAAYGRISARRAR